MSTVVDWNSHPEPWRSIGLRFCKDLGLVCDEPLLKGGEVRARRMALGITQDQLGEAAGYTSRAGGGDAVSKAELGHAGAVLTRRITTALDRLEAEAAQ